jgi:2-aminoethylphosphonate-pyruvate transaminase
MPQDKNSPILLTPGPLTTSAETRAAMSRDWGSRDHDFMALTAWVRAALCRIAGVAPEGGSHVAVPIQGSGTFAVEATIGTLVPISGKLLVLVNGAYGQRIVEICRRLGRSCVHLGWAEDQPTDAERVAGALADDTGITHVAAIHCETTSGILNPVEEIAAHVAGAGRALIVDAMSSFGALPFDLSTIPADAVIASSNKCLEGVPGIGFAVIRRASLEAAKGTAPFLSLDLYDQWRGFEANGQWRFTPPTHVLAAFGKAIELHESEGGVAGRGARYRRNCETLVGGMRALGFETFLPDDLQAPIIVTFHEPDDAKFDFQRFYDGLGARGCIIYPGKLTRAASFRIGCIGALDKDDMERVLAAVPEVLKEMGVRDGAPARD